MKKLVLQIILTILLAGITQLFLPWWTLAIAAALIAIFFQYKYSYNSYFAGFISLFLLWSVYALWIYSGETGVVLSDKIGTLFGGLNGLTLVFVSGLFAGVLGGFGALTGTLGRNLFTVSDGS